MALTAPTPPTPPVVPRVVLGGGGSVTESTQPVSGTSNEETQARAAVARGDGALSKTTTEASDGKQGAAQPGIQQPAQAAQQAAQSGGATEAAAAAGAQETQEDAAAQQTAQQQALEEGRQAPAAGGHGALYIGFSIVSFLVLAAAVFFWLRRRTAQGGLRFEEMARDLRGGAPPSEDVPELRGLTAGEVLEDLEAEEQRQLAEARARAQAWRAQRARERAAAQEQDAPHAAEDVQRAPRSAAQGNRQEIGAQSAPAASQQLEEKTERHFEVRI